MNAVQVFGTKKHPDVRKALRFFSERRIDMHFVDFKVRGPSAGELRRFVQRFGVDAVIDRAGRRYQDLGLGTASYSESRWIEKLVDEPDLLVQPLVRCGNQVTIGFDDQVWKTWV